MDVPLPCPVFIGGSTGGVGASVITAAVFLSSENRKTLFSYFFHSQNCGSHLVWLLLRYSSTYLDRQPEQDAQMSPFAVLFLLEDTLGASR